MLQETSFEEIEEKKLHQRSYILLFICFRSNDIVRSPSSHFDPLLHYVLVKLLYFLSMLRKKTV